jgi:hypothetical protein
MMTFCVVEGVFYGEPENPLNFEPFGKPPAKTKLVYKSGG